jgi:hypothetical protein
MNSPIVERVPYPWQHGNSNRPVRISQPHGPTWHISNNVLGETFPCRPSPLGTQESDMIRSSIVVAMEASLLALRANRVVVMPFLDLVEAQKAICQNYLSFDLSCACVRWRSSAIPATSLT